MSALADADFAAWVEDARAVTVAEEIARRSIRLIKSGREELVGPCPVCGGRDRFSLNLKKDVFHCRGSGRGGDAIALVQYLDGADFLAACETLTRRPPPRGEGTRLSPEELAAREEERRKREAAQRDTSDHYREAERRRLFARWRAARRDLAGTAAEEYLALRGIPDPRSRALRFSPDEPYFHGEALDERGYRAPRVIHRGPALLAAITDAEGIFRGLHITHIDLAMPMGKAEIADPETGEMLPSKKVRGSMRGGVIALLPAGPGAARTVYAGEGIETVLSVWTALVALGWDLSETAFACGISLGNLAGAAAESAPHPTLIVTDRRGARRRQKVPGPVPRWDSPAMPVPAECEALALLADGDSERFLTECAMARAAARHAAPGRAVRIAWAPEGCDFNDLLLRPTVPAVGAEGRA
ncbi:DUF7146 domain-containing protein [Xanthobacter sediminis]